MFFHRKKLTMLRFDEYFLGVYGDRWQKIRQALVTEPVQGLFKNPFVDVSAEPFLGLKQWVPGLWIKNPNVQTSPQRTTSGLLDVYILDPASVYVARSLGVQPGDQVLDMCAAPGGKSLVLASALKEQGKLTSNDLSDERRTRMRKIFDQYLPAFIYERVDVKGWDAVQFGLRTKENFDRVLLDAPCSGERHMISHPKDLEEWKPKRAEALAQRQYALLCAALLAAKPGGVIVYSTCSINPIENDEVIAKLLKKKGDDFKLEELDLPEEGERTQFGVQFLPDRCGFGPMYCCRISKL